MATFFCSQANLDQPGSVEGKVVGSVLLVRRILSGYCFKGTCPRPPPFLLLGGPAWRPSSLLKRQAGHSECRLSRDSGGWRREVGFWTRESGA